MKEREKEGKERRERGRQRSGGGNVKGEKSLLRVHIVTHWYT